MCGFVAYVPAAPRSTRVPRGGDDPHLERMLQALAHRGPDDVGSAWVEASSAAGSGAAWLGSRRLAVLDPGPAGHQPMRDEATGNVLVLNGEIYNHLELRRELGGEAVPWRSGSDTETVLAAYQCWGRGVLDRLRGMFAFALWDAAAAELFCARDRLGIKPLYVLARPDGVFLASEVRALLAGGFSDLALDPEALAGYVRFGSVPEPSTLVAGVRSVPAGSWLRVASGGVVTQGTWWRPADAVAAGAAGHPVEGLRELLAEAVEDHLLSDVEVATFLSGGIDSSIVSALAAAASTRPLTAYTVGLDDARLDERAHAGRVAEQHGLRHEILQLNADEAAALVPQAVRAMDQPTIDGLNTFVVSRAVADAGFKVALSGLGGDELFGGYPGFGLLARARRWAPWLGRFPWHLRRILGGGGGRGERAAELAAHGATLRDRYHVLRSLWSRRELAAMGLAEAPPLAAADAPEAPFATQVSLLELTGYMRSTLLRDADGLSMAGSLELRVPLLDHRVVEHCLRTDAAGHAGGAKAALLAAAGDLLPAGLAARPKQGFVLPMEAWMRDRLAGFVADGLGALADARVLSGVDLDALNEDFRTGRRSWARLWVFVVLGHWIEVHGFGGSLHASAEQEP